MPLIIEKVNTIDRAQVRRFVALPYRLYRQHPQWVPPPRQDIALMLNREKHPFYEHSDADFFVALRDGQAVGRIAAIENRAYNQAFVNNWEYYPLSDNELTFVVNNIIMVADARLIKVIMHKDAIVGFLFGFPDVSAALQRAQGLLTPWAIADLLLEMRRTSWIALNGAGILPEFHGVGGNALLYAEMEDTLCTYHFAHADLTQVAESAVQMRHDLENVGGKMYKNHRVYRRGL